MRGLIEGKKARKYAGWVGRSRKTEIFDKFILEHVKGKNIKICDFCCGSGNTLELLGHRAKELVGVDASCEMIKICREKFNKNPRIKLLLSSAEKTDLQSNYFDYAIIRMSLHHIKEKGKVIDEMHRVLKPRGKAIVIDKFYLNKHLHFFGELLKSVCARDFSVFDHFVESKESNEKVLSRKFKMVKTEFLPASRWKSKQVFMFVLEKKHR